MMIDIIGILRALEFIQGSSFLSNQEKREIVKELQSSLPAKRLCVTSQRTHEIVEAILSRTLDAEQVRSNGTDTRETQASVQAPAPEACSEASLHAPTGSEGVDAGPGDDSKAYGRTSQVGSGEKRRKVAGKAVGSA